MKKKNRTFLLILLFILIAFFLLFFVYKIGSFSNYTAFVDDMIGRIKSIPGTNDKKSETDGQISGDSEASNLKPDNSFLMTDNVDITRKNPVFCGLYDGTAKEPVSNDTPGFITEPYNIRTEKFSYESEWKFITAPCSYGSYMAVFTGEPALNIFSWFDGLLYSCSIPVYPEKIIFFDSDLLVFNSRDGGTYYFDLNGDTHFPSDSKTTNSLKQLFEPDAKCASSIISRLEMWTDKKMSKLPPVSFFPAETASGLKNTSSLYDRESALVIYVYSPPVQGRYKVGFADENGNWSSSGAFVFVFLQDGEMLSMNFEYYADKPQVEVNLSENEFYYFVCGSSEGIEIPENTHIAVRGMF